MKKLQKIGRFAVLAVLTLTGAALAVPPPTCDPTAVAAARATIDDVCPCAGKPVSGDLVPWKNHEQYLECLAKELEAAAVGVPKKCLKKLVPCAAQSTCGKSEDASAACASARAVACETDANCAQSTCSAKDPKECADVGGSVAVEPCCSQ